MRKNRQWISIVAAMVLAVYGLGACGKAAKTSAAGKEAALALGSESAPAAPGYLAVDAAKPMEPVRGGQGAMPGPVDERKIIRTGHLRVMIDAYDPARAEIERLVKQSGGFIASSDVLHHEGKVSEATLVLRVPAHAYGDLVKQVGALGAVVEESTSAEDVTAEYIDLSARLSNAKRLEQRLLEIAAQKTGNVADLLEVERELARVRGEIEQMEGRLRYLEHNVTLSTLTVRLTTKSPEIAAAAPPTLKSKMSAQLDHSIMALGDLGTGILLALVALGPWLLLLGPLGLLLWRRYRARRTAAAAR